MPNSVGAFEGLTGSTPGVPCVAGLGEGRSPITSAPVTSLAGDFLRATRERQGVSQEELARRVGSHQPQVSAWETGRKPIQVEQLAARLKALGLELRLGAEPKRGE
jgi:ribosome-binding protein aMBF1 (putative translation factor)